MLEKGRGLGKPSTKHIQMDPSDLSSEPMPPIGAQDDNSCVLVPHGGLAIAS